MSSDCFLAPSELQEARFRAFESRERKAVEEKREALEEAMSEWHIARSQLAECLRARKPTPAELAYGQENCQCGAPLAYWPEALGEAWECSALLLGHATDGAHDEPILFVSSSIRPDHRRRT